MSTSSARRSVIDMTEILCAYASRHGSTREVAEAIAATLGERGIGVGVRPADAVEDVAGYDAVVVGGALYTGRWHRDARRFLARHARALAGKPLAVFAMGPRTLDAPDVRASRGQLDHALARHPELRPFTVAIFGGVVDPSQLRFPFNRMPAGDARDWDAIRAWAQEIAAHVPTAVGAGAP
jgi:menaquinone-dependent protoporphyrinogen oxidase